MNVSVAEPPVEVLTPRRHRLIAIRRNVPSELLEGSRADSVRSILAEAEHSTSAIDERAALESVGLRDVSSDPSRLRRDPSAAGFVALPLTQCYVLDTPDPGRLVDATDVLQDYAIIPDIELGLPEPTAHGQRLSFDQAKDAAVRVDESGLALAAEQGNRGAGAVIAMLDTGCDADHRDFAARHVGFASIPIALDGRPRAVRGFDSANHGTHVAGIAAGASFGIAPEAHLFVVSVIESETVRTALSRIVRGLQWLLRQLSAPALADKPVVLNLSLGFRREWITATELANAMTGVRLLLQQLVQAFDVLPVVAIGNDGAGILRAPGYFPEVLSVGAVDAGLTPWESSGGGRGPSPFEDRVEPGLVGLGVDVVSSLERDAAGTSWYGLKNGTSMAAPYVTGIAALVASHTALHGAALRDHLLDTALALPHDADRVGRGLARYAV